MLTSFEFDTCVNRGDTSSTKWNKYAGQDVLPFWIADMDFASPSSVCDALRIRIDHGILGYTDPPQSLVEAVQDYIRRRYDWAISPDWLVWLPGLVQGLHLACRATGKRGDSVLVPTPVYPPFLKAPGFSDQHLLTVPLQEKGGRWYWNFDALEQAITARTTLLLLCHPHNPVGRIWHEEELYTLIALARRHQLIVCSDEIHCDLLLEPGERHTPFAKIDPDFLHSTITLMSPSKTWNLGGMGCAFALIPDPSLRERFIQERARCGSTVNLFGYIAAEAAYRDDGKWHAALLSYLRENAEILKKWFVFHPYLKWTVPQATYLAWIDARAIDPVHPLPYFEAVGVGPCDGRDFGLPGYVRINFGCPKSILIEGLRRMERL